VISSGLKIPIHETSVLLIDLGAFAAEVGFSPRTMGVGKLQRSFVSWRPRIAGQHRWIIVEVHDCFIAGRMQLLRRRFDPSNRIEELWSRPRRSRPTPGLARIFFMKNAPRRPKPPLRPLPERLFRANPAQPRWNQLSGLVQTWRILHDTSRHAISGLATPLPPKICSSIAS
jgi:hypothetical protein